jgi:A/G-specific adenine glycosylase
MLNLRGVQLAKARISRVVNTTDTVEGFQSKLLTRVEDNLREYSWRETTDPYEVLVAEVLLQKTAADKVEPIYRELLSTP